MDDSLEKLVRKWAIVNALEYGGKADPSAVTGKVLAERPDLRPQARVVAATVMSTVEIINQMGINGLRKIWELEYGEILPEKRHGGPEKPRLPPLPQAKEFQMVVTRFAPNPDFVLHLGNARPLILSHDYARMYNGKFIVRFEDTDPRLKKASLDFYRIILDDINWLGCKPDEIINQSDRLDQYYGVALELLQKGKAYVCIHRPQTMRPLLLASKACTCRRLPTSKQVERWDRMLDGYYQEGEAVVRIVTDLEHPNPAVRDWPALRIIDPVKHPHPRVGRKYRVWPLYNFAAGCDDHLMGITHIIRGKEHYTNMVRQKYMYEHLGWKYPVAVHHGRMGIEGVILHKSKILAGIKTALYKGYDDPRLGTLQALRRRGFSPEVIRLIIYEANIRPVESRVSWEKVYAHQRRLVDPIAHRYFLVEDPVQLHIQTPSGQKDVLLAKHPTKREAGIRHLRLIPENGFYKVFVEEEDMRKSLGKVVRLMGAINVEITQKKDGIYMGTEIPGDVDEVKRAGGMFIHWLPQYQVLQTMLVKPEGVKENAFAEPEIQVEPINSLIQLERVGFARIDAKEPVLKLYFTCR